MRVLALYLDAPLQSWGYQSRFDRRTSLSYPTRSGVLGMICAAMGFDWNDRDGLARLDALSLCVHAFGPPSRLIDYHTVGGGYDKKAERQKMPRKANEASPGTVQTYREYLQDARFAVLLAGQAELLEEIASALENPRWGIWLGRKSCIPASPVCQGFFDSEDEAVSHIAMLTGRERTRCVREVSAFDEGTDTLMDWPLAFDERRFGPRRVDDEPL